MPSGCTIVHCCWVSPTNHWTIASTQLLDWKSRWNCPETFNAFLQWIHDDWWFMQPLELWNRFQKMVTHGDAWWRMVTHGDAWWRHNLLCTIGKIHGCTSSLAGHPLYLHNDLHVSSLYFLFFLLMILYTILYFSWPCNSAKDVELRDDRSRADCTVAWTTWWFPSKCSGPKNWPSWRRKSRKRRRRWKDIKRVSRCLK